MSSQWERFDRYCLRYPDLHFSLDRVFEKIEDGLETTLTIVISKSGGTKETRNGMLEAAARYKAAKLNFAKHAVAVTGHGSELDRHAESEGWLARFPMFDWVGGRTSVMSAVGLLPMALQGLNTEQFLAGAAAMDEKTRVTDALSNAAMLLALMWYKIGDGRGLKDMVILPYKDRLVLFSKYLQQLVMESLGKLELQARLVKELGSRKGKTATAGELAKAVQADTEDIFHVLTHLSAPGGKVVRHSGDRPSEDTFVLE